MPGHCHINRRASVHTSNEDGVSIQGLFNIPDNLFTKPEAKKLGTHFRRRASLAHVELKEDAHRILGRRGSVSSCDNHYEPLVVHHEPRKPTTSHSGRSRSSEDHAPARSLPSLLSSSRSPDNPAVKRQGGVPSPKTPSQKTRSSLGSRSQSRSPELSRQQFLTPDNSDAINQLFLDDSASADSNSPKGETGWATKTGQKKRQDRLHMLLGRKDLAPDALRKEMLSPLTAVKNLPRTVTRKLAVPDPVVLSGNDMEAESVDSSPGEDLSESQKFLPSTPKFDSMKKSATFSHPSLKGLLAKIVPKNDQLTGLEKTLSALKAELNSEEFRKSYQKMISRPRSARSCRILNMFPDYVRQQNEETFAQRRLYRTRLEIRETLLQSHVTLEISSALLLKHFKDVPTKDLSSYISCFFDAYDTNTNGTLEIDEVQKALQDLGKQCSVNDVKEFFAKAGAAGESIDRMHFEDMVRTMQGWEVSPTKSPIANAVRKTGTPPETAVLQLFRPQELMADAGGCNKALGSKPGSAASQ